MRIHSLNTWKTMACLLTMTLAACSADELIEMAGPDGTPVRVEHNDSESDMAVGFNISLAGSHRLNIGEDDADTRAANGVQATTFAYTTSAQSWSKVAIFWDKGDNNFTRAEYTTKANSATPVGSGFYYATSSQTACHMYGWYPYVNHSHTIQMDQSSKVNYAKSDLLLTTAASASDVATSTRTKTNNVWSETKGTLNFKHVMTKFILKMTAVYGVTINKVELLSVKPTAAISITGGSGTAVSKIALAAASGTAAALTLFSTDNTVNDYTNSSGNAATKNKTAFTNSDGQVILAAVIPPQSLSGNFIHVNTTAGDVYYTLGSTAKAFTGGQTYTVTFSVTQHEVGKTIDISNWNPSASTNVNIATANTLTMSKSVLVYDYNPTQQTVSSAVTKTAHTGVAPTSYTISASGFSATGTINASTGAVEIKYGGSNNAGTTTFTVTSKSGSTTLASYTFDVVVRKIKPTVTLGTPAMALAKRGSATSTVTVTGDGAVSVASSSDSNIATAVKDGSNIKVTGKTTIGTCAINLNIAASANYVGTTAAIAVSVGLSESTFSLNKTALTYTYGGDNQTAKISGVTGSNSFSVASSNTGVATVSISGTTVTVTPVAVGTALITVTQAASNSYATSVKTIAVTVNKADNQITLSNNNIQTLDELKSSGNYESADITVSNVRGTLGWGDEPLPSGMTRSITGNTVKFTIAPTVAPGTYTFTLRDNASTTSYTSSTAVITVTVQSVVSVPLTLAPLGWVIASNGLAYPTKAMAESVDATAVAMVAYVGPNNDDAGTGSYSTSFNHGLAIALTDVSDTSGNPGASKLSWDNAITAASAYTAGRPASSSAWMLPSAFQWRRMFEACGGTAFSSSLSDGSWSCGSFRTLLTSCGGYKVQGGHYWSCTEYSRNTFIYAWNYAFESSKWFYNDKPYSIYARPCFAY